MDVEKLMERVSSLPDGNAWPSTIELINDLADALQSLAAELAAEKAKHRETLAVLQTAHECEEAAQATIRRLMNDLQAHRDALAQVEPKR